jgi:hypothetical protein
MSQILTLKLSVPNFGCQPRSASHTSQEWEAQRSEITRLYGDEKIKLKDVIKIMETDYSFFASYVLALDAPQEELV